MRNALLVLAGISAFIAVVIYSNPSEFMPVIYGSDARYIIAGLMLMTANVFFRTMKWKVLLKDFPFKDILPVQLAGIAVSNFSPGKFAEPVKAVFLKMRRGTAVSETLPSILWERINDFFAMILLSVLLLVLVGVTNNVFYIGAASILVFMAGIAVFVLVMRNESVGTRIFSLRRHFPVFRRIDDDFAKRFYKSRVRRYSLVKSFAFTLVSWIVDGLVFFAAFAAIGVSINPLVLAGIVSFSVLLGIASFLPGGIGSTEIVMIVLFGLIGVESSAAFAGIILARLMTFWYMSLLGGASLVYLGKK